MHQHMYSQINNKRLKLTEQNIQNHELKCNYNNHMWVINENKYYQHRTYGTGSALCDIVCLILKLLISVINKEERIKQARMAGDVK